MPVPMWRSEDNLQNLVLSFRVNFRTALNLSGLQQAPFPNSPLCQPLKDTFGKDNTISML